MQKIKQTQQIQEGSDTRNNVAKSLKDLVQFERLKVLSKIQDQFLRNEIQQELHREDQNDTQKQKYETLIDSILDYKVSLLDKQSIKQYIENLVQDKFKNKKMKQFLFHIDQIYEKLNISKISVQKSCDQSDIILTMLKDISNKLEQNYLTKNSLNKLNKEVEMIKQYKQNLKYFYDINSFQKLDQHMHIVLKEKIVLEFIDLKKLYGKKSLLEISYFQKHQKLLEYLYIQQKHKFNKNDFLKNCKNGNFDAVYCNLRDGVDKDQRYECGRTALMSVSLDNNKSILLLLIDFSFELNVQSTQGYTALTESCYWGNYEIAQILLDNRIDVNTKENDGITAFINACRKERENIIKLLLWKDIDFDAKYENKTGIQHIKNQQLKNRIKQYAITNDLRIDMKYFN